MGTGVSSISSQGVGSGVTSTAFSHPGYSLIPTSTQDQNAIGGPMAQAFAEGDIGDGGSSAGSTATLSSIEDSFSAIDNLVQSLPSGLKKMIEPIVNQMKDWFRQMLKLLNSDADEESDEDALDDSNSNSQCSPAAPSTGGSSVSQAVPNNGATPTISSDNQAAQILRNDPSFLNGNTNPPRGEKELFDRQYLQTVANTSPNQQTRAAAQHVLDNFGKFDTRSGTPDKDGNVKKDGIVSLSDLYADQPGAGQPVSTGGSNTNAATTGNSTDSNGGGNNGNSSGNSSSGSAAIGGSGSAGSSGWPGSGMPSTATASGTTNQPAGASVSSSYNGGSGRKTADTWHVDADRTQYQLAGNKPSPGAENRWDELSKQSIAVWDNGSEGTGDHVKRTCDDARAKGQEASLVFYNIPNRDCLHEAGSGSFSSGGASSREDYMQKASQFAKNVGNTSATICMEPDAIPMSDNLTPEQATERKQMMNDAMDLIHKECPNAKIILDVGNSQWKTPADAAAMAKDCLSHADGFATNSDCFNDPDSEAKWGREFRLAAGLPSNYLQMVDCGRTAPGGNANGHFNRPDWRWTGIAAGTQIDDGYNTRAWIVKNPGEQD